MYIAIVTTCTDDMTSLISVSYCTAWFNDDDTSGDFDNELLSQHIENNVRALDHQLCTTAKVLNRIA